MSNVVVVWDSWFKVGNEAEGLRLTQSFWKDMSTCTGYISHEILVDEDDARHIIQIGRCHTREDADNVREKYKNSEAVKQLTPLLEKPRERWITKASNV